MILDEYTEFCDATALNTGGAGSYLLGDVMDLNGSGVVERDIGTGEPMYFVITVDTAVTSGGSGTYQFTLASDAQAAIATDGSASVHCQTIAIPKATLVAGYKLIFPLSWEGVVYERYLGVLQTTAVAAATAGKINAFLTRNPAHYIAYADATN